MDDTPNYDVDGDGRITIKDAAEILRVMSGARFGWCLPRVLMRTRTGRLISAM